jgi:hypothetical protein
MPLTKEQQELVQAVYQDARQTWSQVTLVFLQEQAERVLSGQRPQGGPGVFRADAFHRAGFIQ